MPEIAYINGEFLPLERAVVHVEDRGFQFADAVYEALRTYHGQPFAIAEHLERLFRSLDAVELRHEFTPAQIEAIVREGVTRADFPEALIYLQITRGQARRHRGFPAHATPTVTMTVRQLDDTRQLRENGIHAITVLDQRWDRCDIKCVALLANVLAYRAAQKAGVNDAIFVGADHTVYEATASNVFLVHAGKLLTPPQGPKILTGVTRGKILAAGKAAGIPTAECRITRDDLLTADEVFLTSTTAEVVPVLSVDGKPIGTGKPGPVGAEIYRSFVKLFVAGP